MRDAGEPGGGAVRAGDAGAAVQADVPAEQGAHDRAVGALLPPGRVPPPPAPAGAGLARPGRAPRPRAGHRGRRRLHARRLGGTRLQHVPRHEEGECRKRTHMPWDLIRVPCLTAVVECSCSFLFVETWN